MAAAKILTPAELASELGTDARTARKFLRSITPKDDQPGKGGRWEIKGAQVRSLRTRFVKFQAAQEAARQERADAAAEAVAEEADEPTDEELEAITE